MSWGLLKGLGMGMEKATDTIADRLRQERVNEFNRQATQQAQGFQREMKQEDRAYQKEVRAEDLARESAKNPVKTEYIKDGGREFKVAYNDQGAEIAREELRPEEKDRFVKGDSFYDTEAGEWITNPDKAGSGVTSQQISAAKSILSQYKDAYPEDLTPQEQAEIQQAKSIIQRAAGISTENMPDPPVTDDPLYQEAQDKAEQWADEGGFLGFGGRDFEGFGGSRTDAIQQKTMEYYNQMKGGGQSGGGLLRQPGASGAANPDPMADMPNPEQHKGRMIRDEETGQMYKSDGKTWKPV